MESRNTETALHDNKRCVQCEQHWHVQSFRVVRDGNVVESDTCAYCGYLERTEQLKQQQERERKRKRRR